jgi:hypothetical protein
MRQYESLALSREKSVRSLRNTSKKLVVEQLPAVVEVSPEKTENIISNFLQKIRVESELEIVQPGSIEEVREMYHETSLRGLVSKELSIENSLIDQLQQSCSSPLNDSRI